MKIFLALAAVSVSYSAVTIAQTERDLESHVHGSATLNVAITDSSLLIELSSPWNNMVGFEHSPETEEEHNSVDEALELLNDPAQLLVFDGGQCTLEETVVENTMEDEHHEDDHGDEHHDDEEGHAEEGHAEEGHAEEGHAEEGHAEEGHAEEGHAEEGHAEEGHGHEDEGEGESHTAVLVTYSYQCNDIGALNSIDLKLFSVWSGFTDLDAQLVGPSGQALVELNPESTSLDIAQVN